jgi:hypothetical protein
VVYSGYICGPCLTISDRVHFEEVVALSMLGKTEGHTGLLSAFLNCLSISIRDGISFESNVVIWRLTSRNCAFLCGFSQVALLLHPSQVAGAEITTTFGGYGVQLRLEVCSSGTPQRDGRISTASAVRKSGERLWLRLRGRLITTCLSIVFAFVFLSQRRSILSRGFAFILRAQRQCHIP